MPKVSEKSETLNETARKARIFIVDDHSIVRSGLQRIIDEQPDMEVAGEADNGLSALEGIKSTRPDLALIDISLKGMDGLELIKHARSLYPSLVVLVLSMHDELLYAERAIRAGAVGYMMKEEAAENIVPVLRKILRGESYLSEKMHNHLVKRIAGKAGKAGASPLRHLSDRELEIFNLLGQGRRIQKIAEDLSISVKTVETHCAHLRKKLDRKGSVELMQFAIRWFHTHGT
ncbi:MAG: two component transcriptional regulator, LuxR family [Fibrobacteres bacterium]|nr:two component transcriptional regulator, LuxR family [Fibrobacterota bacterium]